MSSDERIAAVASGNRVVTEALLAAAVAHAIAAGAKVVGLLAETPLDRDQACGAGILRDIASNKPFSIRLVDPPAHTSCVLDAAGVAAASVAILDRIAGCDLVVLSKFGKLEAGGAGLIQVFETSRKLRRPILTSVSGRHRAAWKSFAPCAADLDPDE